MNDIEASLRAGLHDLADELPVGDGWQHASGAVTRHRQRRRQRLVIGATCAALVIVAGGSTALATTVFSSSAPAPVGTSLDPTPPPTSPAPTTAAPTTASTTAPSGAPSTPASSAPRSTQAPTTAARSSSAVPPATGTSAAATTAQPAWPREAVAVHGGRYWAVYLAVAYDAGDPELAQAQASAQAVGYAGGIGDVQCETGAAEGLGLDPAKSYSAASVFFDTRADAQAFVDRYAPGVVGTVQVTASCLD